MNMKEKSHREILKLIGIDIDTINDGSEESKTKKGFLKGLIKEYTKHVERFSDKDTQDYFHNFIAALMLEFHQAYENYDIKIPYRIKSPKSVFDKILDYLVRPDKSIYSLNSNGENEGRLKEDIKDMFAITVVATNRIPLFSSSKDSELKELIEEQKRNYALLEEMQNFQDQITEGMFPGKSRKVYNYNCTREEYYLNCMILINRIKTLIHPNATGLLKYYDGILEQIKENVPEEFYRVANMATQDQEILESLDSVEHIDLARKLTRRFIDYSKLKGHEINFLSGKITPAEVKKLDFCTLVNDFTARIHDKLDLVVLTKQIKSIFDKSTILKKFDIKISEASLKEKRTENGYVSNFLYLDTPFGKVEMQLQSDHEHREGNYGYSAHFEMDGKGFQKIPIPKEGDTEGIDVFRKCVEFISPHKFLAQFDNSEQNRILTQVFGKYQNYKAILSQVKKGTINDLNVKKYLDKLFASKNTIFEGEAEQEEIKCYTYYDIGKYLRSPEFKAIQAKSREEEK